MQNQNLHSWPWGQGSTGSPFPGAQPILPSGFPPTAADPTPIIPGYQIYGNPPVQQPDYGHWSSAQLQQWQQWQQWQEKYQQWQAQYGKKYEESLAAMGQNSNMILQGLPPVVGASKLIKTPAPDPPLPVNSQPVPPPPPDEDKPPPPTALAKDSSEGYKNGCQEMKDSSEELSEAEKTFDIQFKQWEGQFNAWKKENQDHPDKAQYREYEKKWETWREQLLQRREQMRKKRLNQSSGDGGGGAAHSGKIEDSKKNSSEIGAGSTRAKSDADYSYSSQPSSAIQSSFTGDSSKPPLLSQETACPSNFSRLGSTDVGRNSFNSTQLNFLPGSGHFSGNQDKSEHNKPLMVSSSQIISRNQGPYGIQVGNFGGQMKGFPGSNGRFGDFEGTANEESLNQRPRNLGQGEGSVFESGKSDNFAPRQKIGNAGERLPGSFPSPQRFHPEKNDKFRNGKNFGSQRFVEDYRDKELGQIFDKGKAEDADEFRQGIGNRQSENINMQSSKPKVPSLFDITVEKPLGLKESGSERNLKIWEKNDREGYFGDSTDNKHKELEKNDNLRGNNVLRNKNAASPWLQPWELEKMNNQKLLEARNLERIMGKDNEPWLKDVSQNQEMQKAELSGYVGSILAKLGHLNACPDNERGKFLRPGDLSSQFDFVGNNPKECNPRVENERRELFPAYCGNSDSMSRNLSRNFTMQNDSEFFRNRPEQNVKDSDSRFPNKVGDASGNSAAARGLDFDETIQFAAADIDERDLFRNQDLSSKSQDRTAEDNLHGGEDRTSFGRDDSRNISRTFPRDDRRGFGNEDKFFTRDLNRVIARDDRAFGLGSPREDIDERFGRWGRRNFEPRELRGFVERFGRGRERPLNEPVWNPQVFDYSQGRPLRILDPEKAFKISTVVDYSHGENKQTFDYGHGDMNNDKMEVKSFEYGHSVEIPTVIDYGHGVKNDGDLKRDKSESNFGDRGKTTSSVHLAMRSRSPKNQIRSRSRSPNSRQKSGSDSPSFKDKRLKGSGKNLMRRVRRNSDEKLSPGDDSVSKHSFDVTTVLVEDLICLPGRETRPNKLVFIMRGIPGSGKTYVTKLIKDKETEMGGDPPRILSLDDYFMTEVEKETIDEDTGRKVKTKRLEYEYEAAAEPHYRGSLIKAFKKTVSDGFFSFIIVDSVNEKTQDYEEMWSFAKQKGFQVYIAEMDNDVTVCTGRNIHKRTEKEISDLAAIWEETPFHYLRLDVRSLLQSDAITEVEMEVVSDSELEKSGVKEKQREDKEKKEEEEETSQEEKEENEEEKEGKKDEDAADEDLEKKMDEEEDEPGVTIFVKSRWDQFENSEQNLDRLDGLKRRRGGFHTTMEDYLQLPDDLDEDVRDSVPGKKRVRWADLEERRQQEKMRAIGFVVGQTDWSRMTDPTFGESALTRTKYI